MAFWSDLAKIFTYAYETDALARATQASQFTGAGIPYANMVPNIGQDGSFWGGQSRGLISLRDTGEYIDLSSVSNRLSRYKEYERLRNMPEIENAMTVMADETCISGNTIISTLFGDHSIEWLTKKYKGEKFLVYCWDFKKQDFTLGWAYDPRVVKEAETIRIILDNGKEVEVTPDHRILKKDGTWIEAEKLELGDELVPFYRVPANQRLTSQKINLFPRIFTFTHGWTHERLFINEWKTGEVPNDAKRIYKAQQYIKNKCKLYKVRLDDNVHYQEYHANKLGFSTPELRWLCRKPEQRKVIGILKGKKMPVYDLSVDEHENFCTDTCVLHNCQKNDKGNTFEIITKNKEIREELNLVAFHREFWNWNRRIWNITKKLCIMGDCFLEMVISPSKPSLGILRMEELPPDSMFRIETTKARLIEFQQSKEGPDIQALVRGDITQATDEEIAASTAIRFTPMQIIHIRLGEDRTLFYPYGQSLIEPARGPAHQLRLMEDSMLVYRLSRAPERRVFYIDTGQIAGAKAEAYMERIKDLLKKKKVPARSGSGASGVEERYSSPPPDEDFFVPTRANSNTRIETLPGAANLNDVNDVMYFREKLYISLNYPKNYFLSDDPNATRITASAQDIKFARMISRIQNYLEDAIWTMCDRHLRLKGYPPELYHDLQIKMTPPSDWQEQAKQEIIQSRINNATALKGSNLYSTYDILVDCLKVPEEEALKKVARVRLELIEQMKLSVIQSNPSLLGVGVPGESEQEISAETGGPNPLLGPEEQQPNEMPNPEMSNNEPNDQPVEEPKQDLDVLSQATSDEIKKYDLEIQNYESEMDHEDIDYSV